MSGEWWTGTRLVFERRLLESARSRTFRIVTGLLLLVSAASIILPKMLLDETTTYTLATVGPAPAGLVAAVDAAAGTDVEVEYVSRDDEADVRQAIQDGDATVGLAGDTLYSASQDAGTFPVVVTQALVSLETNRVLVELGLSPDQVTRLQSIQPPRQVTVGRTADEGRTLLGLGVGMVLNLALLFGGTAIATAVALEKTTRISEVLLAVLRPSQILVGTVSAVGTVTLTQLLVLGAPFAVALRVSDDMGLPAVAAADIALGLVWFLLGFALYSFLYAACGALVDKVTEVDTAVTPVITMITGSFLIAIFVVGEDPQGTWSVLASMFPITAPLVMPLRWASGEVPAYQLVIAMTLTAAGAVAMVYVAALVYSRALLITGRRVRFREAVVTATGTPPGR